MAMYVAEHKIINLLTTLGDFFVITFHNVFNVWPKATLLLPVWPRDTKSLDTPVRVDSTTSMLIFHLKTWITSFYFSNTPVWPYLGPQHHLKFYVLQTFSLWDSCPCICVCALCLDYNLFPLLVSHLHSYFAFLHSKCDFLSLSDFFVLI